MRNEKYETWLIGVYCFAHWPLLTLSGAKFWDDWSLYGAERNTLLDVFDQASAPWAGYLHWAIQALLGWWSYSVLAFFFFLLITLCTFNIVRLITRDSASAFWVATFTALLPTNLARVAAISLPATVALLVFTASWLALQLASERKQASLRLLAPIGFLFSFQTASLLTLYVFPVVTYLAARSRLLRDRREFGQLIFRSIDLLVLPIAFWTARAYLFPAHGMFAGDYNKPTIKLSLLMESWQPALHLIEGDGLLLSLRIAIVLALAAALTPCWTLRSLPEFAPKPVRGVLVPIVFGMALVFLASFPYAAVGRFPDYADWTSTRHQLTLSFGVAVLLYFAGQAISARIPGNPISRPNFLAAIVLVLSVNWWSIYWTFAIDVIRQEATIQLLRQNASLRGSNVLLIDATHMSAFGTPVGIGEYAGLASEAGYGHDTLIVDYESTNGRQGWRSFISMFSKFRGPWSKTELSDPLKEPSVYLLRRGQNFSLDISVVARIYAELWFRPGSLNTALGAMLILEEPL